MRPSTVIVWILLVSSTLGYEINFSPSLDSLIADLKQLGSDLVNDGGGYVEFWFAKMLDEEGYDGALFDRLIASEPFVSNPKRIISNEFGIEADASRMASLVIVIVSDDPQDLQTLLSHFESHTRFVVIFPYRSAQQLSTVLSSCQSSRSINILYVAVFPDTEHYSMFNYKIWENHMNIIGSYHSLDTAFLDQGNLVGRKFVGCTNQNGIFVRLNLKSGLPEGLHVNLVKLVIGRMNGSVKVEFTECLKTDSDPECLQRRLKRPGCAFYFDRWSLRDAAYGVPIMPMLALVMLAPRGGLFNTWDLLKAPLTTSLWMVLLWSAVVYIAGMRVIFKRSGIKVLFYIICGIGGSYLNRRTTLEKLISMSLHLLMFLILSAYEAKIVSFLANWPYLPDISSIDELRPAGIPVVIGNHFIPDSILSDPRMQGLFIRIEPSKDGHMTIPPNAAALNDYETAKGTLHQNFNYKNNRAHFVMIDERLDVQLTFFYFGVRNLLKYRFAQIYQRIQEAGFINHWMKLISLDVKKREHQQPPSFIEYEQLKQLFILFELLCLEGGIAFCWNLPGFVLAKLDGIEKLQQLDRVPKPIRLLEVLKRQFHRENQSNNTASQNRQKNLVQVVSCGAWGFGSPESPPP